MKKTILFIVMIIALVFCCASCDLIPPTDSINNHTHNYGEWFVTENATCTKIGTQVRYCACGEKQSEQIPALSHSIVVLDAVNPTCTENGLSEGKQCSICNEIIVEQNAIDAIGHSNVTRKENEIQADCENNGSFDNVVYCSVCNMVISRDTVTINALGHTEIIDAGISPDCTNSGLTEGKHCSVCNQTLVEQVIIDAIGHINEVVRGYPETCTEYGLTDGVKCKNCGITILEQDYIDPFGHTDEDSDDICDTCDLNLACEHLYTDPVPGQAPTCTQSGFTDGVFCHICGATIGRQPLPALDHTKVIDKAVDPTCTKTGLTEGLHCSVCNMILIAQEVIDELGHTEAAPIKENRVEATCTENGSYDNVVYCSVCNVELSRENVSINALGHYYEKGDCTICGAKDPHYTTDKRYIRCDRDGTPNENGDYILFGEYPQTIKADDITVTSTKDSRGYHLGSDGNYYAAVTAMPYGSGYKFSNDAIISSGTIYYFKVEPIRWRILSTDGETAFILCDNIIANMAYQPDYSNDYTTTANDAPSGTYANNYKYSAVKKWLNATFYETAFTELQQVIILTTEVDNGAESIYSYGADSDFDEKYVCEDTLDKVFLLSQKEVSNPNYKFDVYGTADKDRQMQTSDYSRANGVELYYETDYNYTQYNGCGWWWLRSPHYENSFYARGVSFDGRAANIIFVDHSNVGIVPALRIRLSDTTHTHTESEAVVENKIEATCTENGSYDNVVYCSVCNVELSRENVSINALGHNYENDICTACGCHRESIGLSYTLSDDGTYYIVTGIGSCEDTDVIIPEIYNNLPVTAIGDYAFYNRSNLTSIIISDSVTSIGKYALASCSALASVTIGNAVTEIGEMAFYNCSKLTAVHITDISVWCNISFCYDAYSNPLYYAENLYLDEELITQFIIPDDVTSINDWAFYNCLSLTNVTINDNVSKIGNDAFGSCCNLKSVKIGSGVTSIGDWAFYNCFNLSSVTIPDSVITIGESAFYYCWSLENITIPHSVTLIGDNAFASCYLEEINVDEKNQYYKSIDGNLYTKDCKNLLYYATEKTNSLFTIPDSVTTIEHSAFYHCYKLTSIIISNNLTSIGEKAFYNCSNLRSVYYTGTSEDWDNISINSENYYLTNATRYYYSETEPTEEGNYWHYNENGEVVIWPEYIAPTYSEGLEFTLNSDNVSYSVSGIGTCTDTDIIIPSTYKGLLVTTIGDYAFSGCSNLMRVTIGNNVTEVGTNAFYNCTSLTNMTIPDSISSIGAYAFNGCSNLTNINIGNGVTSIGDSAFYGCGKLENIYISDVEAWLNISFGTAYDTHPNLYGTLHILDENGNEITNLNIPNSITSIRYYALKNCTNLTSLIVPDSVTSIDFDAFYNCSNLANVMIGDGVTKIGSSAFYGCSNLANLMIGDSVTEIGSFAFYGCSGLTSIVIPDSVTSIGDNTFYDCSNLTSVTIGKSVTLIGKNVFKNCSKINDVFISDVESWLNISFGNDVLPNCYGTLHILDESGNEVTELIIPNSISSINTYAFRNCSNLTSIKIPNSVTEIGWGAFYNCSSLNDVYISDVEVWLNISFGNYGAHPNYYGTLHILDESCNEITEIIIPDNITSIGDYAFYNCSNLTSVTITDNVTCIGDYAFKDCSKLINVSIGKSVTSIGESAFSRCTSLTNVIIPDSVITIGNLAFFANWYNLTSVVIGDSITSIGHGAFLDCTKIKNVYYKGTADDWANISIESDNDQLIDATRYYYSETEPTEEGNFWHYVDGEVVVW